MEFPTKLDQDIFNMNNLNSRYWQWFKNNTSEVTIGKVREHSCFYKVLVEYNA